MLLKMVKHTAIALLCILLISSCAGSRGKPRIFENNLRDWALPDDSENVVIAVRYEFISAAVRDTIEARISKLLSDAEDGNKVPVPTEAGEYRTCNCHSIKAPGNSINGYCRWYILYDEKWDYLPIIQEMRKAIRNIQENNPAILVHAVLVFPNGRIASVFDITRLAGR
jgi:hypothetical protein